LISGHYNSPSGTKKQTGITDVWHLYAEKISGLEGLVEATFAGKTSFPPSHQTFQTTIKEFGSRQHLFRLLFILYYARTAEKLRFFQRKLKKNGMLFLFRTIFA